MDKDIIIPSIDSIMLNPDDFEVPEDPAILYDICIGIAYRASEINADIIVKIAEKIPLDFSILLIRSSVQNCKVFVRTKSFAEWCSRNMDILV